MLWEEDDAQQPPQVPDDTVDLVFRLRGRSLPWDHAWSLQQALSRALPWWDDEDQLGVQLIFGVEEGNGWFREEKDGILYLSRRARLVLRLPKQRVADAQALTGRAVDIDGHPLRVEDCTVRLLSPITTLYARHVVSDVEEESAFVDGVRRRLVDMGVLCKKMVCGKGRRLNTPDGPVSTRSLMLAGLAVDDAVTLQRHGLGPGRKMGCGLFVPHKSVESR